MRFDNRVCASCGMCKMIPSGEYTCHVCSKKQAGWDRKEEACVGFLLIIILLVTFFA